MLPFITFVIVPDQYGIRGSILNVIRSTCMYMSIKSKVIGFDGVILKTFQ